MSMPGKRVLTSEQMAGYEVGFVHSVPSSRLRRSGTIVTSSRRRGRLLGDASRVLMDCTCSFVGRGIWRRILDCWTAWKICSVRLSSSNTPGFSISTPRARPG